jgi:amino acid adenylation domain-containing protein
LQNVVGFFVTPLILRNRIPDTATVAEYLTSARRLLLDALEHQQIPFERIVDEVLPARSASHAPIYQLMFDYQSAGPGQVALNGLDCQLIPIASPGAKCDIEITATEIPGRLHLRWVYASKLFFEHTIRRLQKSFERLLAAFVALPGERIAALPFLPEDETAFIMQAARGPRMPLAPHSFAERFASVARSLPGAGAVEFQGETYSYAEIESRANKLAQFLCKLGLCVGLRAAVYLEPGPELVIAILAVLKTGGTYVPIDPAYPEDRVEYILSDADIHVVLCSREAMNEGLPVELKVVPVDLGIQAALFGSQPDEAPKWAEGHAPQIAYVLYTSGSTGKPKGAVISHAALDNYLGHAATYFREDMRGAVVSSSIGFDATITSLLTPLLLGKRVLLLESGLDAVFSGLKHHLLDDEHTWLFKITPAHLSALGHECVGRAPSTTRHVLIIGGEQLDYAVVEQWRSRWLPEARYINEYGPTETVVGCSVFAIDHLSGELPASGAVPIGKPIANTELYAVNDGRLVPIGAVGELHIAGAGLAEGYLNLPELSAQRFVQLPHVDPRQRFYRSGDLVRLRHEGDFEFIKRCDDQVKIRGYRIETGEIEAALRAIEGVREAAVLVQEEASQRMLAAFVQPADEVGDPNVFQRRIRRELAKSLPEYMVPAAFELIDRLPLTVNGKVDKAALAGPQLRSTANRAGKRPVRALAGRHRSGTRRHPRQLPRHRRQLTDVRAPARRDRNPLRLQARYHGVLRIPDHRRTCAPPAAGSRRSACGCGRCWRCAARAERAHAGTGSDRGDRAGRSFSGRRQPRCAVGQPARRPRGLADV